MKGIEPLTSSLPRKRSTPELHRQNRAGDGIRTRDIQLGRLTLYQSELLPQKNGESRIRTYEGVCQQIYSLPHLTALVSPQSI